jgi:cell wall assembly regulator SMI1
MDDMVAKMNALIARLHNQIMEYGRVNEIHHCLPIGGPPGSDDTIRQLEEFLGLRLPPSYRSFLQLHSGYQRLAYPGDMLAAHEMRPPSKCYDSVVQWKKTSALYGDGEVLDGIVIAKQDQPNDQVYLDPNQPTGNGEFAVVLHTPGSSEIYRNLFEFLESRVLFCATDFTN